MRQSHAPQQRFYCQQCSGRECTANANFCYLWRAEDLISIDLDHRRNELVALNLFVNCIMLMFALVSAVTGGE